MKVKDLIQILKEQPQENDVVIAIKSNSGIGSSPFVSINHVFAGIDWDHGKTFLYPKEGLKKL